MKITYLRLTSNHKPALNTPRLEAINKISRLYPSIFLNEIADEYGQFN